MRSLQKTDLVSRFSTVESLQSFLQDRRSFLAGWPNGSAILWSAAQKFTLPVELLLSILQAEFSFLSRRSAWTHLTLITFFRKRFPHVKNFEEGIFNFAHYLAQLSPSQSPFTSYSQKFHSTHSTAYAHYLLMIHHHYFPDERTLFS